ncbi:hypothetical protein [Agromyces sp. Marseille-P2726]|uniref:hypothetical protein n=1 Tax=Agromyces sp. Marseille-P2726 TaxID=2709132 RepID=UPI00156F1FE0|nr:hypothetical protein [Agromyces sp. Marseille-P2726]
MTVSNPTDSDLVIQFTDYNFGADSNGNGGASIGVNNVGVAYPQSPINCNVKVASCAPLPCGAANNSVCVPAGSTLMFWVFSNEFGSSPNTSQYIPWQWLDPSNGCAVVLNSAAYSPTSPPNDAC